MTTQKRDVGLTWINLGTFPYGAKLKWLQGSFVWWRISNERPEAFGEGVRLNRNASADTVPAGKLWARGADGIATIEFIPIESVNDQTGDGVSSYRTEIILDSADIAARQINLDPLPKGRVWINTLHGIQQHQDIDFLVTGGTLHWENLALESLVETGSVLYISYLTEH